MLLNEKDDMFFKDIEKLTNNFSKIFALISYGNKIVKKFGVQIKKDIKNSMVQKYALNFMRKFNSDFLSYSNIKDIVIQGFRSALSELNISSNKFDTESFLSSIDFDDIFADTMYHQKITYAKLKKFYQIFFSDARDIKIDLADGDDVSDISDVTEDKNFGLKFDGNLNESEFVYLFMVFSSVHIFFIILLQMYFDGLVKFLRIELDALKVQADEFKKQNPDGEFDIASELSKLFQSNYSNLNLKSFGYLLDNNSNYACKEFADVLNILDLEGKNPESLLSEKLREVLSNETDAINFLKQVDQKFAKIFLLF